MSLALAHYLKDFSAVQPASSTLIPDISFPDESAFPDMPEAAPVDIEAERREAYSQGHEAATQALLEKHQANMEAAAEVHRQEIEALRARYEVEAGERIAADMKQVTVAITRSVSAGVAHALAPVVTEALTAKAVAGLADLVTAAILDGEVGLISVSGPHDLFESLSARLGANAALLRHVEAEDVDLTVTIGESVLVTRMSAWADSLRKVLE